MSEYAEYLREVFSPFGPITIRRMFGGFGVYHEGLMFGLVADDRLYLKTDSENLSFFEAEGLEPFEYNKKGKMVKMSYHRAPDEIMDDQEQAVIWARRSYEAALRSRASKSKGKTNR
ncbi:MAG: TfoX/Sxy family protein [Cellvibrionaceae bacterium]